MIWQSGFGFIRLCIWYELSLQRSSHGALSIHYEKASHFYVHLISRIVVIAKFWRNQHKDGALATYCKMVNLVLEHTAEDEWGPKQMQRTWGLPLFQRITDAVSFLASLEALCSWYSEYMPKVTLIEGFNTLSTLEYARYGAVASMQPCKTSCLM